MASKENYYKILGVAESATQQEISKAYRSAAKRYHPDLNPGNKEAEAKFKEINEAYSVLNDPQKRASYDRFKDHPGGFAGAQQGGMGGMNMNDIFGDIFGSGGFGDFMDMGGFGNAGGGRARSKANQAVRGSDLSYRVSITLEEAFEGLKKKISFKNEVKCTTCKGSGSKDSSLTNCTKCGGNGVTRMQQGFFVVEQTCRACGGMGQIIKNPCGDCGSKGRVVKPTNLMVNIPPGVENGTKIRIAGEGEAGVRGGASGDLYVCVSVKSHSKYKVEGSDLHLKLPLSVTQAMLGGEIEVETIDKTKTKVQIPQGTETGDNICVKGKGMTRMSSNSRGDLYVHVHVRMPKNLTKSQRELCEKLAKELGDGYANQAKDDGFFAKMRSIWS